MTVYAFTSDLATYPFRISNEDDVTDYLIRVSTAGVMELRGSIGVSGSFSGAALHLPASGSAGTHIDSSGIGVGGTSSTDAANNFMVTSAGALSARSVVIYPKDNTSKALVIANDKSSSANLTEWQDSGANALTKIDTNGSIITRQDLFVFSVFSDTQPVLNISRTTGRLGWGPGGATAIDTRLGRAAAGVVRVGDAGNTLGNALEFNSAPAPGAPAATEGVRLYDEAGVLKWMNSSAAVYDLSVASSKYDMGTYTIRASEWLLAFREARISGTNTLSIQGDLVISDLARLGGVT